ncbi:M23 family metallopeptidase [Micromonospora robiginosa]|uniref:M23 family metallopeptidase n=1 Tax=Micromonospora robiginosa TaxID=2749844 RepID=A0A7L6B0F6_9ACTN|nr:M23 family metallopeptidase [Micromonospora ferruginea]QLQ35374.2 M23 family metallopeptidase [Micromonospora ferruginea]
MTAEAPQNVRPRRRAARAAAVVVALAALVAGAVLVVPLLTRPGPRPAFQLPVACGETWRLSTYPGHDDYDVDLFPTTGAAWGRPVLASADGTVGVAGINGSLGGRTPQDPDGPKGRGGGYWVTLDHGGRWETQYLHLLEPPLVRAGQRVARGQQLGRVGSTGDSGAPHLHYEQRRGWTKVETHFDGVPSGITSDDRERTVRRNSANCP